MKRESTCPRCGAEVAAPNAWSSAWRCAVHGDVQPRHVRSPSSEGLNALLSVTRVPVWLPWPLPAGWIVSGFADAGDEREGSRACAVALSGPAPLGGPGEMVIVAEEPGIGLGAWYAGLAGPDPGPAVFDGTPPQAGVEYNGHEWPLWHIDTESDRAAYAGEAMGNWLWAIFWPAAAGTLAVEDLELRDLRDTDQDLDLPFGAPSPRLQSAE